MQQAAIFRHKQENESIDKAEQLAEELRQRQFAAGDAGSESAVFRTCEEAIAQGEERSFDSVTKAIPCDQALARSGVAPTFERAVGDGRSWCAESGGVEKLPDGGEVGEILALEDLAEIDLDEGRPGEAGVIAHQAEAVAVGAKAPLGVCGLVEPILQGRGGGESAAFADEVGAGAVQVVRRRDHDDRHAAFLRFK